MSIIRFEENELTKLLKKIKRYEFRISQGEKHLIMECERLKIIRDKVHGAYRRTRIMNEISPRVRRKINRKIKVAIERLSSNPMKISAKSSLNRAS